MSKTKITQTLTNVQQSLTELQNTICILKKEIATEPELISLPEPGTIIWVRDGKDELWVPRVFSRVVDSNVLCFMDGKSSGNDLLWNLWAPLNILNDIDPNSEKIDKEDPIA